MKSEIRSKWEDMSLKKDRSRLLCTTYLCGCAMHVEAFEVIDTIDGVQLADPEVHDGLDAIAEFVGVAGPGAWDETEIDGRRYVLIATPFC